jgi:putative endonuclease
MKNSTSRQIGLQAEEATQHFLEKKGLGLIQKNYTCYVGEIDLIMQDREDIVFVEVRYRTDLDYGDAIESITQSKITKLIRTAKHFLQEQGWLYQKNSRFDVVGCHGVEQNTEFEWIKNAFTVDRYI